jgi:hypothetical protein
MPSVVDDGILNITLIAAPEEQARSAEIAESMR